VVTDCPYDGPVAPAAVARVAAALRDLGCFEVSLGETIGQGRPETVDAMLAAVLGELPANRLAGHFHDTAGRALDNIDASLARGLRVFDAAVGGLGGCPYAPGASGNACTETIVHALELMGYDTGVDLDALLAAARRLPALIGHETPSPLVKAGHAHTRPPVPERFAEVAARAAERNPRS